jgi:hypothetical protein
MVSDPIDPEPLLQSRKSRKVERRIPAGHERHADDGRALSFAGSTCVPERDRAGTVIHGPVEWIGA